MDNRDIVTEEMSCPQCGYPTIISRNVVTGESRICCQWCGYLQHETMDGKTYKRQGYGSLHRGDRTEVFRMPLSILARDRIYSEIKKEQDSSFYVFDGKLVPIKGYLPQTLEEYYEQIINEHEYYSSLNAYHDDCDCVPFNEEYEEPLSGLK